MSGAQFTALIGVLLIVAAAAAGWKSELGRVCWLVAFVCLGSAFSQAVLL